jgi:aspartate 1-decarboxylase
MFLKVLRAKIHRATVTDANVEYVGSISIDPDLYEAVGLLPNECVLVADVTNGSRYETYVIPAPRGSRTICINGAAAHLSARGNKVIIMGFAYCTPQEAAELKPRIVLVDDRNDIIRGL